MRGDIMGQSGGAEVLMGERVALKETAFLIQIRRIDAIQKTAVGKAGEWVRSARGSVRLAADDVRMDYYAVKHGLNQ